MLDPETRKHLFSALQPPVGYTLDEAIGTTFTLDLTTLLTVPLAFTFFGEGDVYQVTGAEEEERSDEVSRQPLPDPLALLDGVRRYADRITIFCQAGRIKVPNVIQILHSYLENSVCEVTPRHPGGVFHPKVWVLRYQAENDATDARYRVLMLSRNLTFDNSWDTLLSLDGRLTDHDSPRNHSLADFVAGLPRLAVRQPVETSILDRVSRLQNELRRTEFDLPDPFSDLVFYPMGMTDDRNWPFIRNARRQLVVSPFLAPGFLKRFSDNCTDNVLITRLESAEMLSPVELKPFRNVFVLSAEADPEEEEEAADDEHPATMKQELTPPLTGLHAKLFIAETDRDSYVWTGSANATNAAVRQNVEFLVRLHSDRQQLGIDSFLGDDKGDNVSFSALLQPYEPSDEVTKVDKVQTQLERQAHAIQNELAKAQLAATIEKAGESYQVQMIAPDPLADILNNTSPLFCWPITQHESVAVQLDMTSTCAASFDSISLEGLTSFFAFSVTLRKANRALTSRFVLNIPLQNPPGGRREQILRRLLENRDRVLRYLFFLLADGADAYDVFQTLFRRQARGSGQGSGLGLPANLFESLVRALSNDPSRLDRVDALLQELVQTERSDLLPDEFNRIWKPVWTARQQLNSEGD